MVTNMKEISTAEVLQLINDGNNLSMIDVREYNEVKAGKIPGAKHIPLGELVSRIHEIEKNDQEHIMICRSGNRSRVAQNLLAGLGYKAINMTGGMIAWNGSIE